MPSEYEKVKGIYTTPETSGLYLFTDELVIKIDQNGKFVAQYANDSVGSIDNLYVDEETDQIYVLSGNKIYTIKY
jgi:hypothetical protein